LFNSSVSGGTWPYSYQWYLNDNPISGANSSSWTFTSTSTGSYTVYVKITDSIGIQTTSNIADVTVRSTHDVAVTNVTSSKTVVGQGFSTSINVTVADEGSYNETFNVTAYVNATSIASQSVTLSSGTSTTITFNWNTTGFAKGNYTISAYASPVPDENYTADNNCTGDSVLITKVGDLGSGKPVPQFFQCDGVVDSQDIPLFLQCYRGTAPPEAMYLGDLGSGKPVPQFFQCDGKCDSSDIALFLICYRGTGP